MGLEEFMSTNMIMCDLEFEDFKADLTYSATGSGHYFTLKNIKGSRKAFLKFLTKWETRYTFCIVNDDPKLRDSLIARKYTPDEYNNLRIGRYMLPTNDLKNRMSHGLPCK